MRTCVIDMPGLSSRLLNQLADSATPGWFLDLVGKGKSVIRPVLPAVTMPVQATYTTGVDASAHGMIANGLPAWRLPEIHGNLDLANYADYRANVSFWEQSTKLLTASRSWGAQGRSSAMLFVQSSMGGAADVVVTPKPEHMPDGKVIPSCWTNPSDLHERLLEQLGPFPLHHYWGPMAGMKSSEWIAACARLVWEWHPVDLQWTYIPQLDYDLQRHGPDAQVCVDALAEVLGVLSPLVERISADGGRLVVLSEYGMTGVSRSAAPNVLLREAGLIELNEKREVDYEKSGAFAMCDHQVAHVYCRDEAAVGRAEEALSGIDVVAGMYRGKDRAAVGLDCDRAGELVLFSHEDGWFEYRWWEDFDEAPEFAWVVDIHRKPGYDPLEMFADMKTRRILADQSGLIKGSHGALPSNRDDWPVLIGLEGVGDEVPATDIASLV